MINGGAECSVIKNMFYIICKNIYIKLLTN